MILPDIIADINFYTPENDGRQTPTASNYFACIFVFEDKKHDCRLLLNNTGPITPGENKKNIPIKLLDSDFVLPKLQVGGRFYLWDMRNIAEGVIIEIFNK